MAFAIKYSHARLLKRLPPPNAAEWGIEELLVKLAKGLRRIKRASDRKQVLAAKPVVGDLGKR
jgi:hypothetical protein